MKNDPCRHFDSYKAIYEPRCGCSSCWKKYFQAHPDKVFTAQKGIECFGREAVIKVQGEKFVKQLERYLSEQQPVSQPQEVGMVANV